MIDIQQLKPGDTVRHVQSGKAYKLTEIRKGRVFAVREIEISNPDEWELVEITPEQWAAAKAASTKFSRSTKTSSDGPA